VVAVPGAVEDVQRDRGPAGAQRVGEDQGLLVRDEVVAGAGGEEERRERGGRAGDVADRVGAGSGLAWTEESPSGGSNSVACPLVTPSIAARCPPAERPQAAKKAGSMPSKAARERRQAAACLTSQTAAGNSASPDSRYSMVATA
jgi:hypothetical protein